MYKINVQVIYKNKYQSIWIEILQSVLKFSKQENLTVQINSLPTMFLFLT